MQHQSLRAFLSGEMKPQAFWLEIESEVIASAAVVANGRTGPVIITDGVPTRICCEHIDRLLQALESGALPLSSAAYIADALIFSDDFDWDEDPVADVLFGLSDESGPLAPADLAALRQRLGGASAHRP
jgi:hypothetical protein